MQPDMEAVLAFGPAVRARVGAGLGLDCGRPECKVGGRPRCISPSHLQPAALARFLAALRSDTGATPPPTPPPPAVEAPKPPEGKPAPTAPTGTDPASATLWALIEPAARDAIRALVESEAAKRAVTVTHVFKARPEDPGVKVEGAHKDLPRLVARVRARVNVMLVGPAGCGKTSLCKDAARALGLDYYETCFSGGATEGTVLGKWLPKGEGGRFELLPTAFLDAYEKGGLFLADEVDGADGNVLLAINGALAADRFYHSGLGRWVIRHDSFRYVAAANTFGNGADRIYVGRNALDGASTDRTRAGRMAVGYDDALEERIIDPKVLAWMRDLRAHMDKHKVRDVLSTRFGVDATNLLKEGVPWAEIRTEYLSSWSEDARAKLPASLR